MNAVKSNANQFVIKRTESTVSSSFEYVKGSRSPHIITATTVSEREFRQPAVVLAQLGRVVKANKKA
jgi:hypothetical protein